ncbi:hypothetical protein [Streptomyces sp. 8L]|uniref:hypothetical protein n=1 Tax=Streptomyces sp. 8L TaxID=2877242 RepID=UPI001CD4C8EB|nr:hypothetical protein [Streptomyces sp. 8L]MCA1224227.1 hypothetical protein [Streptomyces sp. 8L]
MQRLVDEVAAEPACVVRLVEVTRVFMIQTNRGELPAFMTDDDDRFGPPTPEFTRLVRGLTAAEPVTMVCEQMTGAERRAAAGAAIETLVSQMRIAHQLGFDDSETLAQRCCGLALLLVEWWLGKTPMARQQFNETWNQHAFGHREAGLPYDGANALALLLGALLHHQACQDQPEDEDDLGPLVFTRVLPFLESPERAAAVLSEFVAPPLADAFNVPIKRYARGNPKFVAELCRYLRVVLAMHVKDCPYGLREIDHACTLAHRVAVLEQDERPYVAAPTSEEGLRVALPWVGVHEEEPAEDAPAARAAGHVWQINVDRVVLERWDVGTARLNEAISEDSSIGEPKYRPEVGLEALRCPPCGSHGPFLAEGSWGDPLTLHCRCGVTMMSPLDAQPDDLGRRLLKRLILCEEDPAYAARRMLASLDVFRERQQKARESRWYRGPDDGDVAVVEAVDRALDLDRSDLVAALTDALRPRLPWRHEGRELTLLLLQALNALSLPAVYDSPDGRHLTGAVRDLLTDMKEENARWAPTRAPVVDRLRSWQAGGGPQLWQDAWARTLEMAKLYFAGIRVGDGRVADGCAGLTLGQYLLAREGDCGVDQVTADDVRNLALPGDGQDPSAVMRRWAERLTAIGHDLDAVDDPVAQLWQHLATDKPTDTFGDQRAPALILGLDILVRSFRVRL